MVLALAAGTLGCEPTPRMSPWGARGGPHLGLFVETPSLERHLAAIDAEARAEGLKPYAAAAVSGRDKTRYEVRAFEGEDGVGRRTTAVRVATPFGVVLALGPLAHDDPRGVATTFVRSMTLGAGTSLSLPADLTGDGHPELFVSSEGGPARLYSLRARGATEVTIELRGGAKELRLAGDGYALWSSREAEPSPSLTPRLERIATFEGGSFSEAHAGARAWHEAEAARDAGPREDEPAPARLSRAARRAFHAAMAASSAADKGAALEALEQEAAPSDLQARWQETLDVIAQEIGVDRRGKRQKK
ncbi:MAG: hypothetical protein IPM79_16485 [Polyangiaceae bacterium]|nr:hypothetical protein [Polyangiaceae bacterium]MBK8939172.1 hypothetical protein [Polyangiaceae bacterium]